MGIRDSSALRIGDVAGDSCQRRRVETRARDAKREYGNDASESRHRANHPAKCKLIVYASTSAGAACCAPSSKNFSAEWAEIIERGKRWPVATSFYCSSSIWWLR